MGLTLASTSSGEELLDELKSSLGGALTLARGAIRVWWPGLTPSSDPGAHPEIRLVGDQGADLDEFRLQFDLSRPWVRAEILKLDYLRRMAEQALTENAEHLRDLKGTERGRSNPSPSVSRGVRWLFELRGVLGFVGSVRIG